MRVRGIRLGENGGDVLFHFQDIGKRHQKATCMGLTGEQSFTDQIVQRCFDTDAAVQIIHHQQKIGLINKVLVFDPAVSLIQRLVHAVLDTGTDSWGVIFGRTQFAGNLVDLFEAESTQFPDEDVRIGFKDFQTVATQLIDQRGYLMVG